jgi:hypothetical protein
MITFSNTNASYIANEGLHNAVIVDAVGTGETKPDRYATVRLVWEVEQTYRNGRRMTVTKIYHSMEEIRQEFEAVLGSRHPLMTGESIDMEILVGLSCRVDIVHNPKKDGTMFPHVQLVMVAGPQALQPSDRYIRLKDRPKAEA